MKHLIILFTVLVSFTSFAKTQQSVGITVVDVYYFHGKMRCPTCRNMESYSREAVEKYFKKEIESGKVNFKVIDVEAKGNEHYVTDYKLYTKTLIISATKNGKEVQYKNLDKIWEYSRDKKKFVDYVKNEVAGYLRIK